MSTRTTPGTIEPGTAVTTGEGETPTPRIQKPTIPPAPSTTSASTAQSSFSNLPDDILAMIIKLSEKKYPLLLTCKRILYMAGDLSYGEAAVTIDSEDQWGRPKKYTKCYVGQLVEGAQLEAPSTHRPFGRELKARFLARITSLTVRADEFHENNEKEENNHTKDVILLRKLKTLPFDIFSRLSHLTLRTDHYPHCTELIELALALSALCHPETFNWGMYGYAGYPVRRGRVEDPQLRFAGGHLPKEVVYHLGSSDFDIYWPIPCYGTSNEVIIWGPYNEESGAKKAKRFLPFLKSVHPECRKRAERLRSDESRGDGDDGRVRDATTWPFTWKKLRPESHRQWYNATAGWSAVVLE
ncbi:hypothetical protein IAT38_007529 [Cryptococcus sp. DSM 104549]